MGHDHRHTVFEVRKFDQIARRIVEHHPARIGVFFDTPRQLDVMRAKSSDGVATSLITLPAGSLAV